MLFMKFQPSRSLLSVKAYEPGKPLKEVEREFNIRNAVKLASNENPFGYSPKVAGAVEKQMAQMHRYPESGAFELVNALGRMYRVDPANIVVGNGSDDIIAMLANGFLNPGDEAVMPLPSFLLYESCVHIAKGVPVKVPLVDFSTNLTGIVERITPRSRMIFITNPFNPTGSVVTQQEFEAFCARVPDDVLIVVDEAYIEFVRDDAVYNSLTVPLADPRIVTLRTFSKVYGLAGFRVGYAVMDRQVAAVLNRVRLPFNVNALAQAAAAAALEDVTFLNRTIRETHEGIDFLTEQFQRMNLRSLSTQSNFMMVDVKKDASTVIEQMLCLGVIVRSMKPYGYQTWLRVNTGTKQENRKFVRSLEKVLNTEGES
jgi:histidinol-phosphate aminotransferase